MVTGGVCDPVTARPARGSSFVATTPPSTIRSYVQIVDAFRQHTGARLDRITPAQLRRYHLFLLEERRLAVGTVVASRTSAL
jgi:hypothetical protein